MSGRKTEQLEELAEPAEDETEPGSLSAALTNALHLAAGGAEEGPVIVDIAGMDPIDGPGIPAPPGFTRMTHPDLAATADVPDPAVPFHRSRGWETQADHTDPPSGDNPTTPED